MELAGVDRETADIALATHKEVWLAVDSLIQKPATASDRYIPQKPKAFTDLTLEQKEMCDRGRWLQDQINAVFSVAHSKTLPQPNDLVMVPEDEALPQSVSLPASALAPSVSQPDADEQTLLQDSQSS